MLKYWTQFRHLEESLNYWRAEVSDPVFILGFYQGKNDIRLPSVTDICRGKMKPSLFFVNITSTYGSNVTKIFKVKPKIVNSSVLAY